MLQAKVELRDIEGFDAQALEVIQAVDANLEEVAKFVHAEAKNTEAFVNKTGNLRLSIKKRKSKFENGGYIVQASGKGKDKGYHAHLVEFGHVLIAWGHITGKRVAPHPFLRPALEKGIRKAVALFRGAVK